MKRRSFVQKLIALPAALVAVPLVTEKWVETIETEWGDLTILHPNSMDKCPNKGSLIDWDEVKVIHAKPYYNSERFNEVDRELKAIEFRNAT